MAAPAHASTGTYYEDASATPAFAVPAGVVADDVIIVGVFVDGTATITGLATGFAEAENSPSALDIGGGSHSLHVLWKRASGADTGTYDFTLSGSAFAAGAALRYTGTVTSGSPWDSPTDAAQDATLAGTTPAVAATTAGPDRLLIFAGTIWSGGDWTPPTGYTERVDNGFGHLLVADLAQAAAGDSGSITATSTGSDRRCAWLGALAGESLSAPLTLTDAPTAAQLGGMVGQHLTGLATTDSRAALRAGGPAGTLLTGVALGDQPTGIRAADPDGLLLLDVIHPDRPQSARADGAGETLTAGLLHSDLPAATRLGGPAGTLLLGGATTLTDTPSAARPAGTTGAVLLGSSYVWPPTAGQITVLPVATGTVAVHRVATGDVSVR